MPACEEIVKGKLTGQVYRVVCYVTSCDVEIEQNGKTYFVALNCSKQEAYKAIDEREQSIAGGDSVMV